ncbi:hypothetical protein D9M68_854800 [compost metagenome]
MATGAGSDLAVGNATAVNALAQTDQVLVLGETGFGFLLGQPVSDVAHVIIGQAARKAFHDRVVPFAGLELAQLLDQVLRMLLGQAGVDRGGRVAVGSMASHTHLAEQGRTFGQIGLGRLGMGAERQGCGGSGTKK